MKPNSVLAEVEQAVSTDKSKAPDLLRKVTDLFLVNAGRYSFEQLDLYDGVFATLVGSIETKVRAALACRLAPSEQAPAQTMRALAKDESFEVAEPVLAQSCALDDDTLVDCAARNDRYALVIATRLALSEKVTDQLVRSPSKQVLSAVASNSGAQISQAGFEQLVEKSDGDDWLTEAIALRGDIPEQQFRLLVSRASAAVQRRLADNPQCSEIMRELLPVLPEQPANERLPEPADYRVAQMLIEPYADSGRLSDRVIQQFAREKRFEEVIYSVARLLNLPRHDIYLLLTERWSSPLAIIFKCAGLQPTTIDDIWTLCRTPKNGSAEELDRLKWEYYSVKRSTADRILRLYRTRITTVPSERSGQGAPAVIF